MAGRTGAYADVESLKQGKYKIGRDYRRSELLLSFIAAFICMIIFTSNMFSTDAFYCSIMDFFSGRVKQKNINYNLYLMVAFPICYYLYNFIDGRWTRKILTMLIYWQRDVTFRHLISFVLILIETAFGIIGLFISKKSKLKIKNKLQEWKKYLKDYDKFPHNYNINETYFGKFLKQIGNLLGIKVNAKISFRDCIYHLLYDFPIILIGKFIYVPQDLQENLAISGNYFEKLKKNFFYQTAVKEDGYLRVSKLTIFEDREYLFGKEIATRIKNNFRSDAEFDDLFYIIEGYLTKSHLYDTKLYLPNDDIYNDKYWQNYNLKHPKNPLPKTKNYKYFQTYLLRKNKDGYYEDNVTISLNAIRIFLYDKVKKYSEFLDEMFSSKSGIGSITQDFGFRILTLTRDVHFRQKIEKLIIKETPNLNERKAKIDRIKAILDKGEEQFKVFNTIKNPHNEATSQNGSTATKNLGARILPFGVRAKMIKKQLGIKNEKFNIFEDENELIDYIKKMLIADFSLVVFKIILGQYMNIPAGTMVVKIESYDTRMILEYYKQFAEIEIVPKKNDGQSDMFESDNYVNLFLQSWAQFCNREDKYKMFSELYFKFNTAEYTKPFNQEELIKLIDQNGLDNIISLAEEKNKNDENNALQDTLNQNMAFSETTTDNTTNTTTNNNNVNSVTENSKNNEVQIQNETEQKKKWWQFRK